MPPALLCAQTIFQLFNQMRAEGRAEPDLLLVRDANRFAAQLFAGHYRAGGKPFLCHLTGTASILFALGESAEVVAAGLLHAAYSQGSFPGKRKRGMTDSKREALRAALGDGVEKLVHDYTIAPWTEASVRDLHARRVALTTSERQTLLMRLANELEDHLDLGISYSAKDPSENLGDTQPLLVEMAETIGGAAFGDELREAFRQNREARVPTALIDKATASYVLSHEDPEPKKPRRRWLRFWK